MIEENFQIIIDEVMHVKILPAQNSDDCSFYDEYGYMQPLASFSRGVDLIKDNPVIITLELRIVSLFPILEIVISINKASHHSAKALLSSDASWLVRPVQ